MLVTLDEMITYLGGNVDSSYEDFLTEQIILVSDTVEAYCGRKFEAANYVQTFYWDDFKKPLKELMLFHYPINTVASVEEDTTAITDYRIAKDMGVLVNKSGWFRSGETLEVTYNAGYATVPSIIQSVVKSIVEERYNKKTNGVNLNFGSDVQRISIPGTISIDFDYSLQGNERKTAYGVVLGNYVNMLDGFRSDRVVIGSGKISYVS